MSKKGGSSFSLKVFKFLGVVWLIHVFTYVSDGFKDMFLIEILPLLFVIGIPVILLEFEPDNKNK